MANTINIDMIILSYAKDDRLQQITLNCINSILQSEDPDQIKFNIVVIESQKELNDYQYLYTQTIYPKQPFGFHSFMNLGIQLTNSPYVCLCNNDLIFHQSWASEILKYMNEFPDLISASPFCTILQPFTGIKLDSGIKFGYRIGYEIAGWCLFTRRTLFNIIGKLDENYEFYGADYDYANTLALLHIRHALITSSYVDHLYNTTLNVLSHHRQHELTKEVSYSNKKWGHRLLPFKIV